ncbi:MAG: glycosyl hydrolase family 18 protein [Candidatus Neomarinimicrobiota bacterium]
MKRIVFCLLFLLLAFSLTAEEISFKGIHQIEWEKYSHEENIFFCKNAPVNINPLKARDTSGAYLSHAVFGYLPYWKRNSAPNYFQYDLLSHIALFDFSVSTNGDISSYPSGWPNDWTAMMNTAHENGVKLIMCVVEFDNDKIHALINDTTASQNFYQNVSSIIKNYDLDGVNIDFEGLHVSDRSAPINNFMQKLSDHIKTQVGPEQEISFAGPAVNWSGWDLPGLVDACDYVFIMGYNYWWSGSSTTGPCAPIGGASYNLEQSIVSSTSGYGNCNRSKLILGLPYYGLKWKVPETQRSKVNANTLSSGKSIFYASTMDMFSTHGRQWSSKYEDSWTFYKSDGEWYQSWCSDAISMDAKEKLVFEYDLMGTGMWALGYDEDKPDLWNILRDNFLRFNDSLLLDDFEEGKGHFYRHPTYSGSTSGISSESYTELSGSAFAGDSSLKIVLIDDPETSKDWKVRLLSGGGTVANNIRFPREREIFFSCKTDQSGTYISILIDDEDGEMEQSVPLQLISDNEWHRYSVRLDSTELWDSYLNGNGSIDGKLVSLDGLLITSAEQSEEKTIYLDEIRAIKIDDPIGVSIINKPETHELLSSYPNPFNPSTTLKFDLDKDSHVGLKIYDIQGRCVKTLVQESRSAGEHKLFWQASHLSTGIYIAKLTIDRKVQSTHKLILLK